MPTIRKLEAKHEKCGRGPVIEERDGPRTRIVCSGCWERTTYFVTAEGAREKWRKMQAETVQQSTN